MGCMRLGTRILISYILIIVILASGLFVIYDIFAIGTVTRDNISAASEGVANMGRENQEMARKTLTLHGETILELIAERDANRAAVYLSGMDKGILKDYAALRADARLRAIVAHKIFVYGREAGYTDLLDLNGNAVIHPNPEVEGKSFSVWKDKYPEMWRIVEESFSNKFASGHYRFIGADGNPVSKFMAICRVPGTDFNLAAAVSIKNYFGPVEEEIGRVESRLRGAVSHRISQATLASSKKVKLISIPFVLLVTGVCLLSALWFSGTIVKPIGNLIAAVRTIGAGNFSCMVSESGPYEARELARAFNMLGGQLSQYTESLKREISARQSVESEIKIAGAIQNALLPRNFPDNEHFEVAAGLQPAKEVAGDFYDCFQCGGRLFLVVGDVSGKGVPAAFFMAVVRTMIRDLSHHQSDPGVILSKANRYLCEENSACMFVTLFLGIYDIDSGVLHYANGGHNEVLRMRAGGCAANFGFTGDMALGVIGETVYQTKSEPVNPGDTLVFYTDGVTEAISPQQVLYGIERMTEVVRGRLGADKGMAELCGAVIGDVLEYECGNRFDDITVMAFRRHGGDFGGKVMG